MNYLLKNGKTAVIRPPRIEDAESLIRLFATVDVFFMVNQPDKTE